MSESAEIRIGDTEREAAMTALGEHMSAGRLDVDEYGERSAKVAAARTRGELLELFTDLPDPRPVFDPRQPVRQAPQFGGPVAQNPSQPNPDEQWGWTTEVAQAWEDRPLGQRLMAGAVPLSAIIAVVLFFTVVHTWWIFLLPAAVVMVGGAVFGDEWNSARHQQREQRHLARERRHNYRHRRDLER